MYIIYYTETYQKNYRNSKQKFLINFRRDKVNIGSGNIMPEHSIFTHFVWASSNNDRLSFPDPMKFLHGECLFLRLGILLSEDRIVDSEQLGVAASASMTSMSRWIFSVLWTVMAVFHGFKTHSAMSWAILNVHFKEPKLIGNENNRIPTLRPVQHLLTRLGCNSPEDELPLAGDIIIA